MSIAHSKPAADALAAGAEGLIAAAATVVGAADKVLQAAKIGCAREGAGGRRHRRRPARHPRPRVARDHRRGAAPDARLGARGSGRGPVRRVRAAAPRSPPSPNTCAQIAGGIPMSQVEIVRPEALGVPRAEIRRFEDEVADIVAAGSTRGRQGAPRRADRRAARRHHLRRHRPRRDARRDPRADAPLLRGRGRAARARMAPEERLHPARGHRQARRARRVRPDAAGGVRRPGARQGGDVRRLRGAVARLHRRRLARHALGDRRRADPQQRHRRAEGEVPAEDRLRRDAADGRVHRAQHRLRPRLARRRAR